MKWIKSLAIIMALITLMAVSVSAQPELPSPGITPDSPFYFLERFFDRFRSNENVMDRRASEIVAMAQKGHERGLARAMEGYEKALERRNREAENNENIAEEVVRQSSNHLAILARVREQVPEEARLGIDRALTEGARNRDNALQKLNKTNPERASLIAEATLNEVMKNTPEQAQRGLQRAFDAVQRRGSPNEVIETATDTVTLIEENNSRRTESVVRNQTAAQEGRSTNGNRPAPPIGRP